MLDGFLGQVQSDFAAVMVGSDFSEIATITDGTDTVALPCLFDAPSQHFDPESDTHVIYEGGRITVSEASTDFNLRRGGLAVSVRGGAYKVRASDWEFDGLGGLVLYLDPVR